MNADEIVKALRLCGETTDCVVERIGCPYYENTDDCKDELLFDAADLIEAQLELQELAKAKADGRMAPVKCPCDASEEAQELMNAKTDGRLVVLPCKVGDTVWKIKAVFSYFSKPMEDRVDRIIISNNEILVCCTSGAKFSINSISKTVFLTREAAEKAIAEVGGE